jgi:hypothetical protein
MRNTRQIETLKIWTPTGEKDVHLLALTNFYDYHFDNGNGKVEYKLIAMESSGSSVDENGNIIQSPPSAIEYVTSRLEIPSEVIQQWGASDDIIWNYVAEQLNLELI